MSLTTDAEILAYIQINDKCLTPSMRGLVTRVRVKAENLVKQYVGYNIETATYEELLPAKQISIRGEGDFTAVGFELVGGTAVPRTTFPSTHRELVLAQRPVRSITSAFDNSAAYNTAEGDWPATSQLPTNSYYLDRDYVGGPCWSGILYRNAGGAWGSTPRSVKITYVAGLSAAELAADFTEFAHAVQVTAAKLIADIAARSNMARTGMGPMQSVSVEDFSASYAGGNAAMIGGFLGAGVASAKMPTEAMQVLSERVHPAKFF